MATFTTNYNLRKPADADFIENDTDINSNMDLIDSAIKARKDEITALQAVDAKTRYVVKGATEVVNNSTVFQNDDDLKFTVSAGKTYVFEMSLYLGGSGLKSGWDWKGRFSFPAGTLSCGFVGPSVAALTTGNLATDMQVGGEAGVTVSPSTARAVGLSDDSQVFALVTGTFVCTTGGTVQLEWAQNTAGAGDTSILAGSRLKVVEV